ncbi:hypothetical protein KIN20_020543 [Parelaphostrongylus tenuis]|uniref:Uncharacterized protein n=1 Tax=Parelaphostrongylus tenuis TaxID=148309 RepID=A0AAD5N3B8_PARTN|nr:hypothetical protein KIN20_020543 [Parelaphostrongylus tenuis]
MKNALTRREDRFEFASKNTQTGTPTAKQKIRRLNSADYAYFVIREQEIMLNYNPFQRILCGTHKFIETIALING